MRAWNEAIAGIADIVPVPLLILISLLVTTLTALAWYFWPAWLPTNWSWRAGARRSSARERGTGPRRRFRLGALRWRLRWRRHRRGQRRASMLDELPPDQLPDLPAAVLALTADELAAAGRYAEAVRERLRAIVRELIEREVIPYFPGWTVTELAAAATRIQPPLGPPLGRAGEVFAGIWYGLQPATVDDDAVMREQAAAVTRTLATPVSGGR